MQSGGVRQRGLGTGNDSSWPGSKVSWFGPLVIRKRLGLMIVEPIDIRENNQAIDRVNMYASCKSLPLMDRITADDSLASGKVDVDLEILGRLSVGSSLA